MACRPTSRVGNVCDASAGRCVKARSAVSIGGGVSVTFERRVVMALPEFRPLGEPAPGPTPPSWRPPGGSVISARAATKTYRVRIVAERASVLIADSHA